MISVVIPLYNKKDSVAHTLECVLNQTYQEFEIVVVDDGSTDGSAEVVEGFADERIRLIRQENGGVSAARNRGIKETRSEYVAFLDADDEWKPEHLQTLVGLMEKYPQCGAYSTNYEFKQGDKVKHTILNKIPFDGEDGVLTNYFEVASCSHPPVWTSAACIKKSLLNEIGGFPVGIKSGEDLLTWTRIAIQTDWAYSLKATAVYCWDDEERARRKENHIEKDLVGDNLMILYDQNPTVCGLKRYVARWFKIRSMCFLQEGQRRLVWKTAAMSLKYNPTNVKVYAFCMISLLPQSIVNKLIARFS